MRGVRAPIAGGAGVIRRSSDAFCSAVPVLLSVSLLLLCYRSAVHIAASRVSFVLDSDPDVLSLLSRLSSAPVGAAGHGHPERRGDRPHHGAGPSRRARGRPPFLHLTRAGTLDDDFFSEADHVDGDHPLRRHEDRAFNSTIVVSHSRLLRLIGGRGESPRHPAAGGIRVKVPPTSPVLFVFTENGGGGDGERGDRAAGADMEIRIFGQGFHLNRRDALALAYLMTLFSVVYFFATVGFLSFYSCAIGVVFVAVVDYLLGRQRPFLKKINAGCRLGTRRVMGFVFLWWVVRDALAQFLCILLFSDVSNQHSVLKLFVRVKLMPFLLTASPLTQWSPGDESGLWWFLLLWAVLDRIVALVFVFSNWIAVADFNRRRRGPEVLWEGLRLVLTMMDRALFLRHVEMMICWNSGRWVLSAIGGPVFAAIVQSVAEVYFMVIWLMCYFDMRCKEGELEGRRFGRRNLEDCINDLG
ncbi:hypothetical protein Taro_032169 [Colocasia esculenta]|uniref:Uncharacterized protein n=1 Tax=Colocasia esculenta TaxID=4460 RepID=A0A843W152_COLES|nr:hypothetical protein [Colocasia esculenta]